MSQEKRKRYALVVAGGQGRRMGGEEPKQFMLLDGRPILMRTLEQLAPHVDGIVLVLPAEQTDHWLSLVMHYECQVRHQLAQGGEERFHSVQQGLKLIPEGAIVAIHDGVRPLVSKQLLKRLFAEVEAHRAVLPALPLVESIRQIAPSTGQSQAVERQAYRTIQTPQLFWSEEIKAAYQAPYQSHFTDDASVYEASFSHPIALVDGERRNIKITNPTDLLVAQALLQAEE